VRAAKLHDLHHVATGYQTTWTGEAEIGAWEIASGCGRFVWAWLLNVGALAVGLVIAPRAVYRAFIRGRHTTNLYHLESDFRDDLLQQSVGVLRGTLHLDGPVPSATTADRFAFGVWVLIAVVYATYQPVLALIFVG
jgi:hypothetical protein